MKISVITVSLNSEKYIRETIDSVLSQSYCDVEYIIVDGGSVDGTVGIVKSYGDRIGEFTSSPDLNMYDAINKGCKLASGEYIGVLNSDDLYCDAHVISDLVLFLKKNPASAIYGNRIEVDSAGVMIKRKRSFQVDRKDVLLSRNLTFISHPCVFIARDLMFKVGLYDIKYKYASDLDLVLRCLDVGKFQYIDRDVACFRLHSGSITSSGKIDTERYAVLRGCGFFAFSRIYREGYYYYIWFRYFMRNPRNLIMKVVGILCR